MAPFNWSRLFRAMIHPTFQHRCVQWEGQADDQFFSLIVLPSLLLAAGVGGRADAQQGGLTRRARGGRPRWPAWPVYVLRDAQVRRGGLHPLT